MTKSQLKVAINGVKRVENAMRPLRKEHRRLCREIDKVKIERVFEQLDRVALRNQ